MLSSRVQQEQINLDAHAFFVSNFSIHLGIKCQTSMAMMNAESGMSRVSGGSQMGM